MFSFQLWVAYAPCSAQHKDAVQVTLEQIDLIKRMVEAYPNQLQLVKTADGELKGQTVKGFHFRVPTMQPNGCIWILVAAPR